FYYFIFTFLLVTRVFLFDMAKDAKCDAYSKLISWLVQYFIIFTGVFYSSNLPYDGLLKISEKQNFAIATRFFR
ncbi:hypothetical protein DE08_21875, partial [Salmonella enterica subsp. enterica serovar Worthington]